MTLLYNFGLTAGSLMAYLLESMLNPVEQHPCIQDELPHNKIIQKNISLATTLLATTTTTIISTVIPSAATTISNTGMGNITLETNR